MAIKIRMVSFERRFKQKYREVMTKFLYLLFFGKYSHLNQRTVRHLQIISSLIKYVLVRHDVDKLFKATPTYQPTIKYCLKHFQSVLKSETVAAYMRSWPVA